MFDRYHNTLKENRNTRLSYELTIPFMLPDWTRRLTRSPPLHRAEKLTAPQVFTLMGSMNLWRIESGMLLTGVSDN